MKKILIAIVIMLGALSAEAITIDEFFQQAKTIESAEYTKISKMMLAIVKKGIKSVELLEIGNLSESEVQNLFKLCDEISLNDEISLIKQDDEAEKTRIWMQVEGSDFKLLILSIDTANGRSDCDIAMMLADKKLLEDKEFIKFQIVTPHYKEMYRVALAVTRNSEDAEDVVQDVLERLWIKRNDIEIESKQKGFFILCAKHQAIDHIKRHNLNMGKINEEAMMVCDNDSTDRVLEEQDHKHSIDLMLKRLSKQTQDIMRLRIFGECEISEIEEITGMSNESIRTNLSRARKKLREMYQMFNR